MHFTITQGTIVPIYDCLLDSIARVQSFGNTVVFFFVGDANAHHSEWLESVSSTGQHGHEAFHFCNLSGSEQLMRGPSHIAGNRLYLLMTEVPAIVDVSLELHSVLQITALLVVCFVLSSLCGSTMPEVLSF